MSVQRKKIRTITHQTHQRKLLRGEVIDERDFKFKSSINETLLPHQYSIVDKLPPVRDQGKEGTCAAMVGADIKAYHEYMDKDEEGKNAFMRGESITDYQPQFIYNRREAIANAEGGMTCRDLFKILQQDGILPMKEFKKMVDLLTDITISDTQKEKIKQTFTNYARNFTIGSYFTLNTVKEVKECITRYGPVLIGVPIYHYDLYQWRPKPGYNQIIGYHAMSIVGWNNGTDDTNGYFLIRNSWGEKWGLMGYTKFYYKEWGAQICLFGCIDTDTDEKNIIKFNEMQSSTNFKMDEINPDDFRPAKITTNIKNDAIDTSYIEKTHKNCCVIC